MKLNCNSFFDGDFEYLNLNEFYLKNQFSIIDTKNPSLIQDALNKLGKNTYGGYGEDRKDIWKGTYMDKTGKYIHLGIDINIKEGTSIYCPFDLHIIHYFKDTDTKIGWGGRLILQKYPYTKGIPFLVLAHLEPKSILSPCYGNYFPKESILGKVGTWPTNGNTFNHLHVQVVYNLDLDNFDGYGNIEDLKNNPNPFEVEF